MIIRARIVVTMHDAPVENGAVAVSENRIVDVGRFDDIKGRNTGGVRTIADRYEETGPIVAARVVMPEDEITLITAGGIALRTAVETGVQACRGLQAAHGTQVNSHGNSSPKPLSLQRQYPLGKDIPNTLPTEKTMKKTLSYVGLILALASGVAAQQKPPVKPAPPSPD